MKKLIIFFVTILAFVGTISYIYAQNKISKNEVTLQNEEYVKLLNNEISGTKLATLMNKTFDKNTANKVEVAKDGSFVDNDTNSILIEIKFLQSDSIFKFEKIYKNKIEEFIRLYSNEKFKCTKLEYHSKTKFVKYLYFEQVEW